MDCNTYKALYPKHSALPLSPAIWDTPEHEEFTDHFHDCTSCGDWTLARRVEKRGVDPADYPCVHIAYHVTEKLESSGVDAFNNPDVVICEFEDSGTFGIPIRDGGSSMITIQYCPWCGIQLPDPADDHGSSGE